MYHSQNGNNMTFVAGRRPSSLHYIDYTSFRLIATNGMIGLVHADWRLNSIQCATASDYCHGFMIGWLHSTFAKPRLMLAESTLPRSQVSSLRWRVSSQSGAIDIFDLWPELANPHLRDEAWGFMLDSSGQEYPASHIERDLLAIVHGHIQNPIPNSDNPEQERHCTGSIHASLRVCGMSPIVAYDYLMMPATSRKSEVYKGFADPHIVQYIGTLVWE